MQFSINKLVRAGCLIYCAAHVGLCGKNMIVMRIQPYDSKMKEAQHDKAVHKIETPGAISRTILKHQLLRSGTYDGIFATYGGYIAVSDYDGTIIFPRKHADPEIKLVVTPTIKPVFMLNNIIHHWEFDDTQPTQMYQIEMHKDPETSLYFWETRPVDLPQDKRLPLDSILIFAKPKNIVVPSGATLTPKGGTLILPPVYATKELNTVARALTVADIRIFFKPISFQAQETGDELYASHQITNQ